MDIKRIIDDKARDDLYYVQFPEIILVIAPVAYSRAKAYKVLADSNPSLLVQIEDAFFEEIVIDSDPIIESDEMRDQLKAGIVSTIFMLGLQVSLPPENTGQLNNQFKMAQELTKNSTETQLSLLICRAFGYKPEELQDWTWEKIVKRAAEAQFILRPPVENPAEHVVQNRRFNK